MKDAEGNVVLCGAPRSRDGEPCENPAKQNGRCRFHGGNNRPPGPEHPSWKHGRASKLYEALPSQLRGAFRATIEDPKAFSMLNEVAMLDTRATDLLGKLDLGESSEAWERLRKHAEAALSLIERNPDLGSADADDYRKLRAHVEVVSQVALHGLTDQGTWNELYELFIVRSKLVDTETRRAAQDELTLDKAQVVTLVGWLIHTLMRHVKDRETLEKVLHEVEQLIGPIEEEHGQEVAMLEAG